MARSRRGFALMGLVLAVVACTPSGDDVTPSPTPAQTPPAITPAAGVQVGFVLPAAASADDEQRRQLVDGIDLVDALRDEGISGIRTLEADGSEFVPDLAALLADRGTDLICVLGPDAQRIVTPLAGRHPQLRFCAVPAGAAEPPENVRAIEIRFEELGQVLGVAAGASAGEGPVASVIGSDRIGVGGLRNGIRAGVGDLELLESTPADEEGVLRAIDEAIAADATVLIVDVGVASGAAVERAAAAGIQIIAPAGILHDADLEGFRLLSWRMRWDVPLRPVVAAMLDRETEAPPSVGLAENVFVLSFGGALQGEARAVVEDAVGELREGTRDPLVPPAPAPASPDFEPAEEGDDADDEPPAEDGEGAPQDGGG